MFGKKENDMAKTSNSQLASLGSINSLSQGTTLEGTISTDSDLRIDGTIKGNLDCKGKLIVGPNGLIDGEINCQNAVIEGTVIGNLSVEELLDIKETGNINGEVVTGKIRVQSGAILNFKCQTGGQILSGFGDKKSKKIDAIAS